ncbi:MAG: hypothetical protein KAU20_02525 [Nanoarchaeota archaeon]|nr:hypothetical protein [Nanoarchaeota archaeon]
MHNDQNRDELKVIEALGEGSPALTFEGIKEKTSFSNSKLEHILDPLLKKGIISETKTDENKEESEIGLFIGFFKMFKCIFSFIVNFYETEFHLIWM